jgi:hypothetical protein
VVVSGALAAASPALGAGAVRLVQASHLSHPFGHAVRAERTFQMVGATWRGSGSVRLEARTTSGRWTRWVALSPAEPVWTGPSRRIRLSRSGHVRGLAITFITSSRCGPGS